MEPEQEANASSLASDLLEARTEEDRDPLGVDSEGLEGFAVRPQGISTQEQGNVELLIQFDGDEAETHGILQPQRTSSVTETHSDDERQDEENNYMNRQSNAAGYSNKQQPQRTQEFRVHVGAEADISFGILGNVPQAQNTEQDAQRVPPQLLFTTDEGTDYTADEEFAYIRQPSPPEADLGVEGEAPELQFEPDVKDGEEIPHIRHTKPSVQEDDLKTAQEDPELQFEPEDAAEQDGDEIDRYLRQYQPSAPEDDLENAHESSEMQFEPEDAAEHDGDETDHDFRQPQPSAPEVDLETAKKSPEMEFDPEDAAQHDGDIMNRYFLASQPAPEDDFENTQESPEMQFEPEDAAEHDGDETDHDFRQPQPSAPEVDLETAKKSPEMEFDPEDAAQHDGDIMNRYFLASQPAPEDDFENTQESPEMQFEPEDAAEHDGDETDHDFRQPQPSAPEVDLETAKKSPEMEFDPEDAAQHDGDIMNRYFLASQPAQEDDFENTQESPEMQFEPEADAEHENGDDVSRYFDASGTLAPEAVIGTAEESPEEDQCYLHSRSLVPEAELDAGFPVLHSDQYADDESGEGREGDGYVPESQRVHGKDKEIPVDDNIDNLTQSQTSAQQVNRDDSAQQFKATDHEDVAVVGGDDDGSQHTSQLHSAVQAGVEDDSRLLDSPPSDFLYATASHDGDERSYMSHGNKDQGLGLAREYYSDEEDSPRDFIKGILSEGNSDERYAGNVYEEENEEEDEDDIDDPIDIRDNANVEDQFIEFEEHPYVEAAVGGILEDAGLNGVENGSQEESVGNETGGDDEGDSRASASRVRFEEDDDHHHPDAQADVDDYHIIPGASNMSSYGSHDYDLAEGEDKSLDVLLLEEICEEAASMTIKEALIHSLKPNVRAGLTTAHLKLSESEVLALEEYCEDFVGGLIKDLLKRSSLMDLSSKNTKNVVKASVIKSTAKQLSAMEVQQMKIYCDHFVHNVIAESIIDSSMIVARQQHQAEEVKEVLHMFQNSDELQEYFTNLTTDIVRTALLNVTTKEDSQDVEQSINSTEYEQTEFAEGMEFGDQEEDFDFDGNHSFGFLVANNESPEYRRSRSQESSQESWTSEDDGEMGTGVAGGRQRMIERSPPGHSTLEFDEEWAEGIIGNIDLTTDGEKRQKIFMRELEFDDRANVGGTELLAPVFLAVAEENEDDTEFEGLRRKTQSIEDLCDLIEEEKEPPRKRASSLTQLAKKKPKPRKKPRPNSFHEQMEELKKEAIEENIPDAEPEEERPAMSPESPSSPKTSSEKSFQAYDDERYRWYTIRVSNREKVLDLKLIEPYMKVITHGGVHTPSRAVIVVIAACYLPDKTKRNYDFLMEQLFFYLISTLELLATTDEYFLVYFNGGTTQNNQPALPWMKRFYQHVEGGLKKKMIHMFIVHPNFWLKTVVRFAKAFVGTNFWSKLQFIKSLDELSTKIPVEFIYVPDEVIRCDPKYKRVHNL